MNHESSTHLIVYSSIYTGVLSQIDEVLAEVRHTAKHFNAQSEITGLLFYHNGFFLQVLEGDKGKLETLMEKLTKDPRHQAINRIIDEPVLQRGFANWNMDSLNLSAHEGLDPIELENIAKAYHSSLMPRSDVLVRFYKAMLATHELKYVGL